MGDEKAEERDQHEPQGRSVDYRGVWSPLFVGALALVLFGATAAPGVLWGDSAKLTLMALDVELIPQPGGHPTYVLMAAIWVRLWPSDPAYALNMLSAVSAAIAVALVYRCLRSSLGTAAAVFAAVTLACSHLFWNSATLTESYAPAAAVLAGLLALSLGYMDDPQPWRLWLAALLLSLGAGINSIVIITLPALAILLLYRWRQTGLKHVLPAVFIAGLGLIPFIVAGVASGGGVWAFVAGGGGGESSRPMCSSRPRCSESFFVIRSTLPIRFLVCRVWS